MKDTRTIEEQVAQMTEQEKDKIVNVGIVALVVQCVIAIPLVVLSWIGFWAMTEASYKTADKIFVLSLSLDIVAIIFIIAVCLFVKFKYPDYSDRKWRYIRKERKARKQ